MTLLVEYALASYTDVKLLKKSCKFPPTGRAWSTNQTTVPFILVPFLLNSSSFTEAKPPID